MRHLATRHAAERVGNAVSRTIIEKVDDTKLMQFHTVSAFRNEQQEKIEHAHPYGFVCVPQEPTGSGDSRMGAEGFMAFMGGGRSHGVVFVAGDRRFRLYKLAGGEVALHDDQGQQLHMKRDGIWGSVPNSKKITLQIMDDDQMPQDDSSQQSSGTGGDQKSGSGQKMGQIQQAGRPAAVNVVITKDFMTINVKDLNINASGKINIIGQDKVLIKSTNNHVEVDAPAALVDVQGGGPVIPPFSVSP
jgi:phage gp45-like